MHTRTHTHMYEIPSGIVFSVLYEKVFRERIYHGTRQKLGTLQESDLPKIQESRGGSGSDDRYSQIKRQFPCDVIVGLAPKLYRNIALDVHRREKEGRWSLI